MSTTSVIIEFTNDGEEDTDLLIVGEDGANQLVTTIKPDQTVRQLAPDGTVWLLCTVIKSTGKNAAYTTSVSTSSASILGAAGYLTAEPEAGGEDDDTPTNPGILGAAGYRQPATTNEPGTAGNSGKS